MIDFKYAEPEVGALHLSLPPFVGFSWTPQDVLKVLPTGLTLAFVSSINLLLTSRAVEHFRGRHKHLKGSDADAITAKANALAQASMKLGEAMYKQAADQQTGGGGGAGAGDSKKEDVVDAEFTEVDDDKKNKKSA